MCVNGYYSNLLTWMCAKRNAKHNNMLKALYQRTKSIQSGWKVPDQARRHPPVSSFWWFQWQPCGGSIIRKSCKYIDQSHCRHCMHCRKNRRIVEGASVSIKTDNLPGPQANSQGCRGDWVRLIASEWGRQTFARKHDRTGWHKCRISEVLV